MMKVQLDAARVYVTLRFYRTGAILDESIEAHTQGVDVHLEVDSPADRDRVAAVIRNAEQGCYVMQSLKKPVDVQATFEVNGEAIELRPQATPS
jgi:uncharacterized OsmC-like protein